MAPSQMVGVSASVNLPLHHKVQKFCYGTSSPGRSRQKGRKTVVVWYGGGAKILLRENNENGLKSACEYQNLLGSNSSSALQQVTRYVLLSL